MPKKGASFPIELSEPGFTRSISRHWEISETWEISNEIVTVESVELTEKNVKKNNSFNRLFFDTLKGSNVVLETGKVVFSLVSILGLPDQVRATEVGILFQNQKINILQKVVNGVVLVNQTRKNFRFGNLLKVVGKGRKTLGKVIGPINTPIKFAPALQIWKPITNEGIKISYVFDRRYFYPYSKFQPAFSIGNTVITMIILPSIINYIMKVIIDASSKETLAEDTGLKKLIPTVPPNFFDKIREELKVALEKRLHQVYNAFVQLLNQLAEAIKTKNRKKIRDILEALGKLLGLSFKLILEVYVFLAIGYLLIQGVILISNPLFSIIMKRVAYWINLKNDFQRLQNRFDLLYENCSDIAGDFIILKLNNEALKKKYEKISKLYELVKHKNELLKVENQHFKHIGSVALNKLERVLKRLEHVLKASKFMLKKLSKLENDVIDKCNYEVYEDYMKFLQNLGGSNLKD